MKVTDYSPLTKLTQLWKGISGTRKTSQLAFWPKPMYIFNFDGPDKISPLKLRYEPHIEGIESEFYGPDSFLEAKRKLAALRASCPFTTVVIDSYTMFIRRMLRHARNMRGQGAGRKEIVGIQVNTLEDYNAEATEGFQFIDEFLMLDAQFLILICHIEGVEKDNSGAAIARTILTGGKKLSAALPGPFSEIIHFESKPDIAGHKNVVYTLNTGLDFARTSIPLPAEIDLNQTNLFAEYEKAFKERGLVLL
ncbi:ATP-binding protein [bacterium]|nr:ATP-binding protein [bacterium]